MGTAVVFQCLAAGPRRGGIVGRDLLLIGPLYSRWASVWQKFWDWELLCWFLCLLHNYIWRYRPAHLRILPCWRAEVKRRLGVDAMVWVLSRTRVRNKRNTCFSNTDEIVRIRCTALTSLALSFHESRDSIPWWLTHLSPLLPTVCRLHSAPRGRLQ